MSVGVLKQGIAIPTDFLGITYRSRLEANVYRNAPLPVLICDNSHPSFGTLGYPPLRQGDEIGRCWVCNKLGLDERRCAYLYVAMRSGVPVPVTENIAYEGQ